MGDVKDYEREREVSRKRSYYMRVMESDGDEEMRSSSNKSSRSQSRDLTYPLSATHNSTQTDYELANHHKSPSSDDDFSVVQTDLDLNFLNCSNKYQELRQCAQPLIRAAWEGAFSVKPTKQRNVATFDGFRCCVSSKACPQARLVAGQLPPLIRWEKLPKCCVWPKTFQRQGGPTDGDIALFFFPSLAKHHAVYDSMLFHLIRADLALRTIVMGSELLLFTSVDLPPFPTRFQGNLYLWGVFRGNYQPHLVSQKFV